MAETLREPAAALSLDSGSFPRNMRTFSRQIRKAESAFRLTGALVQTCKMTIAGLACFFIIEGIEKRLILNQVFILSVSFSDLKKPGVILCFSRSESDKPQAASGGRKETRCESSLGAGKEYNGDTFLRKTCFLQPAEETGRRDIRVSCIVEKEEGSASKPGRF